MSSLNKRRSARPSHRVWRLCRMYSSRPASDNVCATSVAQAEPAMPSAGKGPIPKISTGFSTMSSATDTIRKRNGVRESPAPRRAAVRKANAYSVGIARKMICR